jgi:Transposase/Domain of unknown function (DUF4188)
VAPLGLDETSFLKATRLAPTRWITGLVDLEGGRLLDLVADRTRRAVDGWLHARPHGWLARIGTVALDPWRGYASALVAPLGHARVVVDHFHAIRLANTVVDQVRRRVQQATLGYRGRKRDPLYRIRKLLLTAAEQLTQRGRARLRAGLAAGDPAGEVAAAWQGKELLRAVYAAAGTAAARATRSASTVGQTALTRPSCHALPAPYELGRPRSWPGMSPGALPTTPPRPSTCSSRRSSASGTASVTSPITACGCYCTAASRGRLPRPQDCEAAHHAWWRRAALGGSRSAQAWWASPCPAGPVDRLCVRLELIAWGEVPVRLTGPFIRGGGTVAGEHRPGPPAGDAHEVGLVATLGEPGVGEGVAELVGMKARDAGLLAAAVQHVAKPVFGPWASLAEPQPLLVRVLVGCAHAEVPVECSGGLVTEGNGPLPPALAAHVDHVVLEAHVTDAEAEQLVAASAGVEQEHDDGGVAARDEVPARAGVEQAPECVGGHDRDRLLGDVRGAHAGNRVVGDLAFLFQPAVQAPERLEAGGGLPRFLWGLRVLRRVLRDLDAHPERGYLAGRVYRTGRSLVAVQYWESFDALDAWARDHRLPHRKPWQRYLREALGEGAMGLWHETYLASPGSWEGVYVNMPPWGLAAGVEAVEMQTTRGSARERLREQRKRATRAAAEETPPPPP